MVLQYVEHEGSITRRAAAELCKVSSDQAKAILSRLRRRGDLQLLETKRRAHYVLPGREGLASQDEEL
jgi:ATP-dependent DNA helicase RecG